jgi:hypothetical protein
MFEEYLKDILAAYEYKKVEGTLPPNLLHPTPRTLGDECLIAYRKRYNPSDDDVLNLFFTASDKAKGYTKSIQDCNIDDFRQVPKILNGKTPSPGLKFIELLAWLIDFSPRPSTLYYQQKNNNKTTNDPDILVPTEEEPGGQDSGEPQGKDHDTNQTAGQNSEEPQGTDHDTNEAEGQNSGEPEVPDHNTDETSEQETEAPEVIDQETNETAGQKTETGSAGENGKNEDTGTKPAKPIRSVVIACAILFLVAGATFFFWKKKSDIALNPLFTSQKCMYWTGDRYESIDCNEKVSNFSIIPLDTQKLNHLQKITSPDTLTTNALGKVWYTKIAGEHQFFTDSGVHPLDTQKKLKPLTRYILSNHVSYYRYLLTLVIWSICAIILIGLCSVFFIAFRKKRKNRPLILTSPKVLA